MSKQSESGEINRALVGELMSSVRTIYHPKLSVASVKTRVLKDVGLEETSVLRRDFDGCSGVGWLIEKMIGEILTNGRINK